MLCLGWDFDSLPVYQIAFVPGSMCVLSLSLDKQCYLEEEEKKTKTT